jgi:hypothetical protein
LSDARFVELLSDRLGLDAFPMRPAPGLVFAAADAPFSLPRPPARDYAAPVALIDVDTLIWMRFSPGAYLRDWFAGWFDVLLNGAQGLRRRARRARLLDVARAAFFRSGGIDHAQFEGLRQRVLLVELTSPRQALFWLKLQEERALETLPPRG